MPRACPLVPSPLPSSSDLMVNCTVADVALPMSSMLLGGLGSYSACLAATEAVKYCLAGYPTGPDGGTRNYIGLCVASNCSKASVAVLATELQRSVAPFSGQPPVPTGPAEAVFCSGPPPGWTPVQEGALAVFALVLAAVLLASAADYFRWFPEVSDAQVALRGTANGPASPYTSARQHSMDSESASLLTTSRDRHQQRQRSATPPPPPHPPFQGTHSD